MRWFKIKYNFKLMVVFVAVVYALPLKIADLAGMSPSSLGLVFTTGFYVWIFIYLDQTELAKIRAEKILKDEQNTG